MACEKGDQMNTFADALKRYLEIRRSLGFSLDTAERILRKFVLFADAKGAAYMSTDLFLLWQNTFGTASSKTWPKRLSVVRGFAGWLNSVDPKHQVPPRGLCPGKVRRGHPYIYSEDQIRQIVKAADGLPSTNGIRGLTYSTLFGLIAVTGLRISEEVALDDDDVDLNDGIVAVRCGKLKKERILPVSESTVNHLRAYRKECNRLLGKVPIPFFVSDNGIRVTDCSTRYNFASVGRSIGLRSFERFKQHGTGPKVHDLRHTFAVRTMLDWDRLGQDPAREMIKLTTYLGHSDPKDTYWYIEAVPELLQLASERAFRCVELEEKK
jgi:integrase/recombinase XerD